jgi:Uncharacterized protein conserved in bacteria
MRAMLREITPLRSAIRSLRSYQRRRALSQNVHKSPLRVILGASTVYQQDWVPTDIDELNLLHESDWQNYFAPNSIDTLLAEHVWEHLTLEEGTLGAKHCFYYLKPGGYLRIAVPDGNHPDPEYIEMVRPGGSADYAFDHKMLYTIDSLSALLENVGFRVQPLEYFDASGEFHFEMWQPADGMIHRSSRYDKRNKEHAYSYTSLIVDAVKPNIAE